MTKAIASPEMLPSLEGSIWADLDIERSLVDLPSLLATAATRWQDRTAWHFVESGREITFAELARQVNHLAAALRAMGVGQGSYVGIMLRNVPEFPLMWLALACLHAISIPLNPAYTAREFDFIVEDSGMSHLVIAEDLLPILANEAIGRTSARLDHSHVIVVGVQTHGFGTIFEDLFVRATHPFDPLPSADLSSTVSIQFTSGTTGLPKGCVLTHRYWVAFSRVTCALIGEVRNILADHPFYYMQNQLYLVMCLAGGSRIVVTRGLSLSRYLELIWSYDIDFAWISDRLLNLPPSTRDRGHKLMRAPADELLPATHAELEKRFEVAVREWYGSTEVGLGLIVPWNDDSKTGSGSIGIAAPYRETKIIDEALAEVSPGTVGELCIRGPGMMAGYFNRPDTNREIFLDGGWFRTGDLCSRDVDGHHYFKGRLKDVIRRSGEQIAAQEIEHVLGELSGILEAAVVAVPDERRGEEVKAYVVLDPLSQPILDPEKILEWCRSRLARFKVPRYLEVRDELPHTNSGKIAKDQLRRERPDLTLGSYDAVTGRFR